MNHMLGLLGKYIKIIYIYIEVICKLGRDAIKSHDQIGGGCAHR